MNKLSFLHAFYGAVACLMLTAGAALAQPQVPVQVPGSGGPKPGNLPATEIPIDGGVSLLLAAGGAYGLKRLRAARAKK